MVGLTTSQFTRTYTAFSGCDVKAVFHNQVVAEIQGISYSVTREKAPVYTMGQSDPRAFSRGKRGIAGSLIFTVFDRHVLHSIINQSRYMAKFDDIRNPEETVLAVHEISGISPNVALGFELRKAVYSDQVPPFDVTLSAGNEYGQIATMKIYGVEILNEGSGLSIDDIINEAQMTFVARSLTPWIPVESENNPAQDLAAIGSTVVSG